MYAWFFIFSHYFGSSVDIHSGGIDLLFPHHENEEAQCCAYHNVDDWVTHWIHTGLYVTLLYNLIQFFFFNEKDCTIFLTLYFPGHLHVGDNIKMSKSLKNTISVRDLLKSYTANQFRILCLLSNYKSGKKYSCSCSVLAKNQYFEAFYIYIISH